MSVRFYGKGIGQNVRGLFLDGEKVFYRTEKEDKEKQEIDLYGADVTDWLNRWDEGKSVWSVEIGGLGPSYEQCIQITTAEILRFMLHKKYDSSNWKNSALWNKNREEIDKWGQTNPIIDKLGLSGAQWGAAVYLASQFYMKGPKKLMSEIPESRKIQVQKYFPQVEPVTNLNSRRKK
jgi:hypothetical protein